MKSFYRTGLRAMTILPALLLLGACGSQGLEDAEIGDAPEADAQATPGGPVTPPTTPNPGTVPNPSTVTVCGPHKLWFNGACRNVNYLARFVTPGAVFVMVEGQRYDDGREAILIVESPNARTTRVKVIAQKHTSIGLMTRKFLFGHEVLSEYTETQFLGEDGFHETVTTIDAVEGGRFETVWYERVARGSSRKYTWGTDLCVDAYGNSIGYEEGQACGPMMAIASSDGSVDWCAEMGEIANSGSKLACFAAVAYVTVQVGGAVAASAGITSAGTALVVAGAAGSAAVANPAAAAGLTVAAAIAVGEAVDAADTACSAVAEFAEDSARILCEAIQTIPGDTPEPVAIELEAKGSLWEDDPCSEIGGDSYEGGPGVVYSGDCAGEESDGVDGEVNLQLGDSAAYEVTVYGDREECTPVTVSANDDLCVVLSY